MEDVLDVVRSSLTTPAEGVVPSSDGLDLGYPTSEPIVSAGEKRWEDDADDPDFDDRGEGAGIEGDLDMEED